MHPVDVAIVGAGPAGCAGAVQCTRLGLEVALLDRTGSPGGLLANAHRIENYPGLEEPISGPAFASRLKDWIASFGITVQSAEVGSLDRTDHGFHIGLCAPDSTLSTRSGESLHALTAVIATGTKPLTAGFEGESELAGSSLFYEVRPLVATPRLRVLIVGGGEAAFDYALSLAGKGSEVRIYVRSEFHRAGPRLAALVEQQPNIAVEYKRRIAGMRMSGEEIMAEFTAGRACSADAALVAVGRVPDNPWIEPSPSSSVLTTIPGLFIAGDVRLGSLGQAGIAVGDGLECAALAVAHVQQGKD